VSAATDTETIAVQLDDGSVPVLLFAGGTTGLVLLAESKPGRAFCTTLGELAESAGLSALAFAGEIPGDRVLAALRGVRVLESLGVEQTVLVGLGDAAVTALRAAADGAVAAVTLIDPIVPHDELEPLLAAVPAAKLVLVRANDLESQATASAAYQYAVGPMIVRHVWGEDILAGETAAMAAEATLAFAVGACGDGRPA
jgi:pimeloyl-ACP methyl ester carboxylesterase